MAEKTVENVMRDTRKDIRYVIMSDHKMSREEMLHQIRFFNYDPQNLRLKRGTTVTINARDDI